MEKALDRASLRSLERLSRDPVRFTRAFRDLLFSDSRLVSLGLIHSIFPQQHAEQLDRDWFPSRRGAGYWPGLQPIEPTIRDGLIRAFSLAILDSPPLAIRSRPLELECELLEERFGREVYGACREEFRERFPPFGTASGP
jgi:hypothetical protein